MALLHIALQEGFANETVVIRVNGREAFREDAVTTRMQIGRAAGVDVEVAEATATVEVALPRRNLAQATTMDTASPAYLGVSLSREGALQCNVSARPFRYA